MFKGVAGAEDVCLRKPRSCFIGPPVTLSQVERGVTCSRGIILIAGAESTIAVNRHIRPNDHSPSKDSFSSLPGPATDTQSPYRDLIGVFVAPPRVIQCRFRGRPFLLSLAVNTLYYPQREAK